MAEIKFCGLTRSEDVAEAASLGANYVGVIFAGGPRQQTVESARRILGSAGKARRVAVVSDQSPPEIANLVKSLGLSVVQLHADPTVERIRAVTNATAAEVWAVLRIANGTLPDDFEAIADAAGAVVLDAKVPGGLGGTGVALPWAELSRQLGRTRPRRVILAGGLKPENVSEAIAALGPDVVDVASGVESAPGIKDHSRMRAFRDAARGPSVSVKR